MDANNKEKEYLETFSPYDYLITAIILFLVLFSVNAFGISLNDFSIKSFITFRTLIIVLVSIFVVVYLTRRSRALNVKLVTNSENLFIPEKNDIPKNSYTVKIQNPEWGGDIINFHITKDNIKSTYKVVDKKEIDTSKTLVFSGPKISEDYIMYYACKHKLNLVCIEFINKLKCSELSPSYSATQNINELPEIEKIYISVSSPDGLVNDLTSH